MRYVIVGNGPAGISAIEGIREYDPCGEIVIIAFEGKLPYNRILVPEYMVGEVEESELFIRDAAFFEKHKVEVVAGQRAIAVNIEERSITLEDNDNNRDLLKYDRLLLATGSQNVIPSWINRDIRGVFTLWDKADSLKIAAHLEHTGIKRAVIIGAGLLGLQAARAFKSYGLDVTLIEKSSRVMPAQLDEVASEMLCRAAEKLGINICPNTEVKSFRSVKNKIEAVETASAILPADIVLIAIGVKPNIDWVNNAINREQGILVNEYLETNILGIYAAGDIAQTQDPLSGESTVKAIWLNAIRQGKTAGANMAGAREKHARVFCMNSIQLFGLSLIALGNTVNRQGLAPKITNNEQILNYPSSGSYQKLVLSGGNLVGVLFVGDIRQSGILYHKLGCPLTEGYLGNFHLTSGEALMAEEILR
ncbi:MAG: FAD-dependent oxidoreductase [Desulfitobacteriaceae bacterium]|nr:FAD-dependent oxidoreductase [Desulfitobacteriaceae bacterium]MDD4346367.1 FAD-dependent oxidoreductase [Desulfitobacteriaceae bacterium]MDD4401511.1 FAD-dependent oxidoreductase [Desulfitobacteriaceae bacterium]